MLEIERFPPLSGDEAEEINYLNAQAPRYSPIAVLDQDHYGGFNEAPNYVIGHGTSTTFRNQQTYGVGLTVPLPTQVDDDNYGFSSLQIDANNGWVDQEGVGGNDTMIYPAPQFVEPPYESYESQLNYGPLSPGTLHAYSSASHSRDPVSRTMSEPAYQTVSIPWPSSKNPNHLSW